MYYTTDIYYTTEIKVIFYILITECIYLVVSGTPKHGDVWVVVSLCYIDS